MFNQSFKDLFRILCHAKISPEYLRFLFAATSPIGTISSLTTETESLCYGKLLVTISSGDIAARISKTDAVAIHATMYAGNPLWTAHFPLAYFFDALYY